MIKFVLLALLTLLFACSNQPKSSIPLVVTTTGMLGDAVSALLPDSVRVEVLMGPGVDPHLYKATQQDLNRFSSADLIVYNGLYLEGKLSELLGKIPNRTYAAAEIIPDSLLKSPPEFEGAFDPHLWHDLVLWKRVTDSLALELSRRFPQYSEHIAQASAAYSDSLSELHDFVVAHISEIPQHRRLLVTAHDAFGYFGLRYDIEVHPLQGISTVSEFGLADISTMVDFVVDNKIPAVFVESSISPRSIQAIIEGCKAKNHPVKLGGTLYSDALGGVESGANTYISMIRHNVMVIKDALK